MHNLIIRAPRQLPKNVDLDAHIHAFAPLIDSALKRRWATYTYPPGTEELSSAAPVSRTKSKRMVVTLGERGKGTSCRAMGFVIVIGLTRKRMDSVEPISLFFELGRGNFSTT